MKNAVSIVAGVAIGMVALGLLTGSELPEARAQDDPGGAAAAGGEVVQMGIGGSADNRRDLCWVLAKRKGDKGMETHLALYGIERSGTGWGIKLFDSRLIDYDLQVPQLSKTAPTVMTVKRAVERAKKEAAKKRGEKTPKKDD